MWLFNLCIGFYFCILSNELPSYRLPFCISFFMKFLSFVKVGATSPEFEVKCVCPLCMLLGTYACMCVWRNMSSHRPYPTSRVNYWLHFCSVLYLCRNNKFSSHYIPSIWCVCLLVCIKELKYVILFAKNRLFESN